MGRSEPLRLSDFGSTVLQYVLLTGQILKADERLSSAPAFAADRKRLSTQVTLKPIYDRFKNAQLPASDARPSPYLTINPAQTSGGIELIVKVQNAKWRFGIARGFGF